LSLLALLKLQKQLQWTKYNQQPIEY